MTNKQTIPKPWHKKWWGFFLMFIFFPFVILYMILPRTTWNKWIKYIAITLFLISISVSIIMITIVSNQRKQGSSSTKNTKNNITNQKQEQNNQLQIQQKKNKIIDYKIYKEDDISYAGCSRKEYKAVVNDNATQEEIKNVLEDIFSKKEKQSDKIFIYVYKNFQKDKIFYAGRLSMNPDCNNPDDYKIDFDYWSLLKSDIANNTKEAGGEALKKQSEENNRKRKFRQN